MDLEERTLLAYPLSSVTETAIDWLWEGRIPKGAITCIQGSPKLGKSHILSDIAARVSVGESMPGESRAQRFHFHTAEDGSIAEELSSPREPASVLYVQSEDSEEAVLCPRVRASGADLRLVHVIPWVSTPRGLASINIPLDVAAIEAYARTLRPAVGLVVIDPVFNYLAGIDTYVEAEVRTALAPLLALAGNLNCAVILCRHLTKAAKGKANLDAGMGSQGFGALARSTLGVERASGDWRKLKSAGGNYAREPEAIYFRIVDHPPQPAAEALYEFDSRHAPDEDTHEGLSQEEWDERQVLQYNMEYEAEEIAAAWRPVEWTLAVPEEPEGVPVGVEGIEEAAPRLSPKDQEAYAFIVGMVPSGGGIASVDLYEAAGAAGFSEDSIKRAKRAAGCMSSKRGDCWYTARA